MPKSTIINPTHVVGLPRDPSNMVGVWPPIAIMPGARHDQVRKYMLLIMACLSAGDKAVNAEVQVTSVMMKNLCMRMSKIGTEREREIGTKKRFISQ